MTSACRSRPYPIVPRETPSGLGSATGMLRAADDRRAPCPTVAAVQDVRSSGWPGPIVSVIGGHQVRTTSCRLARPSIRDRCEAPTQKKHLMRALKMFALSVGLIFGGAAVGQFSAVDPMMILRFGFSLVPLADGRVLVVGGFTSQVELYDPEARRFSITDHLSEPRLFATATALADGNILVAGGGHDSALTVTASAELYDANSGTFLTVGDMSTPRAEHTATLLDDGRVLIAGGHRVNSSVSALASAELYDPMTRRFIPTGSMTMARQDHTATRLSTGQVLMTGGFDASHYGLSTAEVYDPKSGQFAPTGMLDAARGEHTATLLDSGGVLIVGGYEAEVPLPARALAELYDPANGTFSPAGPMAIPRGSHTATVLADGRLLIAGGFTVFPAVPAPTVPDAEVYDPAAGTFLVDASMVE